jgi:hypothetical protein
MTLAKVAQHIRRIAYDPIYGAGFDQGYSGSSKPRHYAFAVDRAAWADGVRDGKAESRQNSAAAADWASRSRPPRL